MAIGNTLYVKNNMHVNSTVGAVFIWEYSIVQN